jgi:post-segregation antitoxin (ccd killing protein)
MTIYLPDELAADVKSGLGDANVSAICQAALRDELDRQKARAEAIAAEGFERVKTYDAARKRDVAFQGRSIGTDTDRVAEAYLTPRGGIAVVGEGSDNDDQLLGIYVSFGQFASAGYAYDFVAEVADSLGEEPPVQELDI